MVLPAFAPKIHIPVVVMELVFGILKGKSFFNLLLENQIINF
jgi:Kef-type K+ transport system membrane component KefB